jgi:hypothetical protein
MIVPVVHITNVLRPKGRTDYEALLGDESAGDTTGYALSETGESCCQEVHNPHT